MKWIAYLKYFVYLAYHWNAKLAATIIYYEIIGEKKYGINTIGIDELKDSVSGEDRMYASIYQPVNYFIAEWLFSNLTQNEIKNGAFLDAGCGKGRALVMAAYAGFSIVRGIDISPKLCHQAIQLLNELQTLYPDTQFELTCSDAQTYMVPDDTTVIFLFNPFNKKIMKPFIAHVLESISRNPRPIKVLYANPECGDLWEEAGFKKTEAIQKLNWLFGQVFQFLPSK